MITNKSIGMSRRLQSVFVRIISLRRTSRRPPQVDTATRSEGYLFAARGGLQLKNREARFGADSESLDDHLQKLD